MLPAPRRPLCRLLSLLLPVLLMLAQFGAVQHEIGHLQLARGAFVQDGLFTPHLAKKKQDAPIDKLCEVCLAFAHLSTAAKPEVPHLPLLRFEHARVPHDAVHAIAADAPALRSRGPPVLL